MYRKKILFDSILSIIANAIPIAILQLMVLPLVSIHVGSTNYGLIITLFSLVALFSHPFGNALNNIRLLQNKEYEEKEFEGDFNRLALISIIINSILVTVGTIYYEGNFSFFSIVLIIIMSGLNLIREYTVVAFRIILNYKSILINNLLMAIGYILGFLIFYLVGCWELIYITGYLLSLFYIARNSSVLKESFNITPLFRNTTYKSIILLSTVLMRTALTYADKLLIYPLLGPDAVSIYYSATVLGKIITMGISPISSVMLSYLARIESIKIKHFFYIISYSAIACIIGYFFCITISKPLLEYLYPSWSTESIKLINVTTATIVLGVMSSVIHPLILRYNNVNWQVLIGGVNVATYIVFSLMFMNLYGLYGFCIGLLISNIIALFLMVAIFMINYSKRKSREADAA